MLGDGYAELGKHRGVHNQVLFGRVPEVEQFGTGCEPLGELLDNRLLNLIVLTRGKADLLSVRQ